MIKTYVSINSNHLIIPIYIDEITCVVEFKGGRTYPERVNGTFSTSNTKLQKALEADKEFNNSYRLLRCISSIDEQADNVRIKKNSSQKQKIVEVNSRQMAIEWVSSNIGMDLPNAVTIDRIKKIVAERGYVFPNL